MCQLISRKTDIDSVNFVNMSKSTPYFRGIQKWFVLLFGHFLSLFSSTQIISACLFQLCRLNYKKHQLLIFGGSILEEKVLTKRQKQAIQTKQRIFDVTMKLGAERGDEALDINSICKAANISVGTFYHYFRSLDAVYQEQYAAYDSYISKAIQESPLYGSAIERLWQLFSLKYNYVTTQGTSSIVRQYRGHFAQIDSSNSVFYSEDRITFKAVLSILEEGIASGEFHMNESPKMVANALLVFSRGFLIDWTCKNGSYDLKQEALRNLDLIMRQYVVKKEDSAL